MFLSIFLIHTNDILKAYSQLVPNVHFVLAWSLLRPEVPERILLIAYFIYPEQITLSK